jgi:hypothetical protein
MSKNPQSVLIETMEQRLLFDASELTETIGVSTLPAAVSDHAVLKGMLSMTVTNNSGTVQKIPGLEVGFLIADGQLSVPSGNYSVLKSQKTTLNLADGASKVFKFPISVPKGKLNDGVDTLFAIAVDSSGAFSQSDAGPTLTVHPPIVTLSETENFLKLPDSTATGAKFHVTDQVAITNSGTDPSTDPLTIGVYVTPDGVPADGTLMTTITRKVNILAGKTVTVPVNIAAIPTLAAGTYKLITQVTQTNGTITATDPSTAPIVTLTVPTTGPQFSDSIIAPPTLTYTPEPLDGAVQYLSTLEFKMSIKNTGDSADGDDQFTLFASPSATFDSSALQVGQVTLDNLATPKNGLRTFFVSWNLTQDLDNYSDTEIDMYMYVQVKDPTGNVTMAAYPTPVNVGGLIDPSGI